MSQVIRRFVTSELGHTLSPQKGVLHPKEAVFKSLVNVVVEKVLEKQ